MSLVDEYRAAQRQQATAKLRRGLALRAMLADGASQRCLAATLGISQSAVSQQAKSTLNLGEVPSEELLDAAAPVLKRLAADRGFGRLAVFGSVARRRSRPDSDIDLLIEAPRGTTITRLLALKDIFERVLDRKVDLITYGGLKSRIDDDIRRDAVLL